MQDHDNIHAIVFRPLETAPDAASRGTLITQHPNRDSAIAYFNSEKDALTKQYYLPVADHAGKKALGVAIIKPESLFGTVYAATPDRLYREVAHAIQAGQQCHKTYISPVSSRLDAQSAAINSIIQQSEYRYIPLDDVCTPSTPPSARGNPDTHPRSP